AEIESVSMCRLDEGAQRGGVSGPVDQLEKLLVFEPVHHSEGALAGARWRTGFREIGARQTGGEGLRHGCIRLGIPAEPPADGETKVQERADDRRDCERKRAGCSHELVKRDAGAYPWQIDSPDVMERHAGKKVMNPQRQPLELLRRDLWHRLTSLPD